ncbi:magnesium transporter MRS2-3-like [Salvia splendens]|uniref:magnesium transporter MRS2-3-like n=1 Tax=Salvia splendens TaxID=180675 RepID=UPI001C25F849|nr:magnesium transporter MRS2-3-like [Salvia splendens]
MKYPVDSAEAGRARKKGAWVRAWLVVNSAGEAEVVEAGKHAIMQRTGLPGRDLRMLDPALSYPSTVLGRERAIVVNLENIRSIITSREMIFQNSKDPLLTPFVDKIQQVFRHRQAVVSSQESGEEGNKKPVWTDFYGSKEPDPMGDGGDQIYTYQQKKEEWNAEETGENVHDLKILPFEFVALEACLQATCSSLDDEATRLEQEAHPALDKLTSKISTLNLDRVRHIKSRLVAITGRVQKVRDELEHLLDDDEDMAEMYLTEKLEEEEALENSSTKEQDMVDEEADQANFETKMGLDDADEQQAPSMQSSSIKSLDVEELEMILEAYFVQIEGTLNKLSALREYVDDTEDYINIMLDDKQNHLLQMGVVLTTATLVVGAFVALTGVFGMNIGIELFDPKLYGMPEWLWTVGGSIIASVFCYVIAVAWCRYQRLLE